MTHNQVVPGSSPGGPTDTEGVTKIKIVTPFLLTNKSTNI
jgi:hypothetical protein